MFKFTTLWALIFAFVVMTAQAEPAGFRAAQRRAASRFLARQEAEVTDDAGATDAAPPPPVADANQPAPYPAAGVTPAIPFDLPTETEAPLPDEVYGPPEEEPTPDPTYGPPAETTTQSALAGEGDLVSQNLIRPRQRAALVKQRGLVRSQPLLLQAVPVAGAPSVVELVRANSDVIYILK